MNLKYFSRVISIIFIILFSTNTFAATDVHGVMCGGEIREADMTVVNKYMADNPDVNITMEAVPWGTCQDKVINLAIAGDPVSFSYIGSRTLKGLAENGHIVAVDIPDSMKNMYQPGILDTVSHLGKQWGFPHAFSTKALFMNCDILAEAGLACEGPKSWDELYSMAETIQNTTGIAGIGLAGKDFDNTMHQFLNYLYSNGGQVIDPNTNDITLNSPNTVETLEFYAKLANVSQEGPLAWERSQLTELFNDKKIAMYINGPWGAGQHGEINQKTVRIPAGPNGSQGTLLITDSMAIFNGTGHEDIAMDIVANLTSGDAQYDLDTSWGLTPIMQYPQIGSVAPYNTDYWMMFIDAIADGGPEPLLVDYKAFQTVMNSMIQGAILGEGDAADLVAEAAEELEEYK
ncbi:extracellular solute-binding protein [Alphaproteobacteria bacterium]|nr:extracellular solute-binding protein [Alphaproteobacteria bacterium]